MHKTNVVVGGLRPGPRSFPLSVLCVRFGSCADGFFFFFGLSVTHGDSWTRSLPQRTPPACSLALPPLAGNKRRASKQQQHTRKRIFRKNKLNQLSKLSKKTTKYSLESSVESSLLCRTHAHTDRR